MTQRKTGVTIVMVGQVLVTQEVIDDDIKLIAKTKQWGLQHRKDIGDEPA